ncbi:MAG: hypothetical protein ACE5KT_04625 [Methanosarcinales archaeon]
MYALLEKAYLKAQKKEIAKLPTWLSPTQVRIIPVAERHLDYAKLILMTETKLLLKKSVILVESGFLMLWFLVIKKWNLEL